MNACDTDLADVVTWFVGYTITAPGAATSGETDVMTFYEAQRFVDDLFVRFDPGYVQYEIQLLASPFDPE